MIQTVSLLLHIVIIAYVWKSTHAQTALLFGANGVVGSEVLNAIVGDTFWEAVILVGRRFPAKVTDSIASIKNDSKNTGAANKPEIIKIQLSDLSHVDKNEELLEMKADACFIIVGLSAPHQTNINYWNSVEVEMVASMARLCNNIKVQYVALLSAGGGVEEDPTPFSKEELDVDTTVALGWWGMLVKYARIMGLKEKAVTTESKNIPYVRIFQPSTITTEELRYGWVDWTLFRLHKMLDPIIPMQYHSVKVGLLGAVIAGDAVRVLSADHATNRSESSALKTGEARLTYADYLRIIREGDLNRYEIGQGREL